MCACVRAVEADVMLTHILVFVFTEVIKEKGLEHITVDDLVVEITPKGRGTSSSLFR